MTVDTLGDALPREQARVREVLCHYKDLGPIGLFGAAFIEDELREADKTVISGDLTKMIMAYKALKEIE